MPDILNAKRWRQSRNRRFDHNRRANQRRHKIDRRRQRQPHGKITNRAFRLLLAVWSMLRIAAGLPSTKRTPQIRHTRRRAFPRKRHNPARMTRNDDVEKNPLKNQQKYRDGILQ